MRNTVLLLCLGIFVLVCGLQAEEINLAPALSTPAVLAPMETLTAASVMGATESGGFLDSIGTFIAGLDAHVAYYQSFHDTTKSGLALIAGFPIVKTNLPGFLETKTIVFSADVIGFMDSGVDGGVGGSITMEHAISALNLGVGYLPRQTGWSWYVSIVKVY